MPEFKAAPQILQASFSPDPNIASSAMAKKKS
jgi:hypothetical protein